MQILLGAVLLIAQAQPGPAPQPGQADAYLDAGARELVERARERRWLFDRSIERYQVVAQERMSAGLRVAARDRLMFRRETAARIDWNRDTTVHIEVLGAREIIPPVLKGMQLPAALARSVAHLAFDPAGSELLMRMDTTVMRHPLDRNSEAHYRFRSGDTTTIRLQDGREIRLYELTVEPRRRDPDLIAGSLWLDADTHGLVRMVFRLARPWEFGRDADRTRDDDDDDMPGWLNVTAELSYFTIEYGLWDLRWWLPRLVSAEGAIGIGSMMRMPLSYERRYSGYEVEGDTAAAPFLPSDSARRAARRCRQPMRVVVAVGENRERRAAERIERYDSIRARREGVDTTEVGRRCAREFQVAVPADTNALLTSEHLPASIFDNGSVLATETEIRELADRLGQIPEVPWQLPAPQMRLPFSGGGVRFNRIEALSLGMSGKLDLGRLQLDGGARMGVADRVLNAEVGVTRATRSREIRMGAYRRLAAVDPRVNPFGLGNTLAGFFFGRDEGDYFRTLGAELTVRPPALETQWYELRLFAERQREATAETDFSIAHLLNDERRYRLNIAAQAAEQTGARLTLRTFQGTNPAAPRWSAEMSVEAAAGTFDYVKPTLTLRGDAPLPAGLVTSLEISGGRAGGTLPIQSAYFLGSTPTLRGYYPATLVGDAFWRARAELARGTPAARFILFSDLGWAGPRDEIERGRALLSAGAGVGILDGLIRVDLARATRPPTGWRLHLYINGNL
jgi:hypothetical protein